jgi:hypothetical protein
MSEAPKTEKFEIRGEEAMKKVKELIAEGNVRSITISDKEGKVIASFPLTVGVIGAVLAPALAGLGAILALVTECTISVERR